MTSASDQQSTHPANQLVAVGAHRPKRPRFVIAVTALRAALAFTIGIALLTSADRGQSAVAGFMGLYWLVGGIFSLAWSRRGPFLRPLSLVSGLVGVTTGLLLIVYRAGGALTPAPHIVLLAFGAIVAITGLMHITGGFLVGERIDRWPAGHLLLGMLEIVLAAIIVVSAERRQLLELASAIWAFAAGSVLAFDALRLHRRWDRSEPEK